MLLIIIGFVGVFFGKLIKSALSRQREYLADASAVQFTRNPDGIAGALKKIGALTSGSHVGSANAEQASHMFFGDALKASWFGAMATHPPLPERIARIDPSFSGRFDEVRPARRKQRRAPAEDEAAGQEEDTGIPLGAGPVIGQSGVGREIFGADADAAMAVTPALLLAQIGSPTTAHLEYARALRQSIPAPVLDAAREAYGARAVIYGLLLDARTEVREAQLTCLQEHAEAPVYEDTVKLLPEFAKLHSRQRLPLVDIAMPALQTLSDTQGRDFCDNVKRLVEADAEINLFEYTLQGILRRHLESRSEGGKAPVVKYYSLVSLKRQCAILLSALARQADDDETAARALAAAATRLQLGSDDVTLIPLADCGLGEVDGALQELRTVSPKYKRMVAEACIVCIAMDGKITVLEPRFIGGFLGKYVQPRLKRSHLTIELDEVGTLVWDACDGQRDIRAIAVLLSQRFGDDFDPEYQRLALFIRTMVQRGWIRYREQ